VAHKFFSRKVLKSNLDLFCPIGKCPEVVLWLVHAGYYFADTSGVAVESFKANFVCVVGNGDTALENATVTSVDKLYESKEIVGVWTFVDPLHAKWVQVVGTRGSPIAAMLLFHSSEFCITMKDHLLKCIMLQLLS
jgi:hypothetical protein